MTLTTRFLRTILQLRHIFFTDAPTFILLLPVYHYVKAYKLLIYLDIYFNASILTHHRVNSLSLAVIHIDMT